MKLGGGRVPRPRGLAWALACALAAGGAAGASELGLELDSPREEEIVRSPVDLIEVRGWAGGFARGGHDVLIVLDRSVSTWRASGSDVDRDGITASDYPNPVENLPMLWTNDFDDTIISAELAAARGLIERLQSDTTRMGLITFGGSARRRAPLGSSRDELLAALDDLSPSRPNLHGTYVYGALQAGLKEFPRDDPARRRSIVLLSDGLPTTPTPPSAARKAAVRAATLAARDGVRMYSFILGRNGRDESVFEEMTRANRGQLVVVERPGDVIDHVPYMSLTDLERVEVVNLSHASPARALRVLPDGAFDGYLPVEPGRNRIRVTAVDLSGRTRTLERWVEFEKLAMTAPGAQEQARELLRELRLRTLETELAERARRRRAEARERDKRLDIRPER